MAEFMKEHDNRQDEQEGDDVADEPMAQHIETMDKKLEHSIPLDKSQRLRPQSSRLPLRQFEAIGRRLYFWRYGQRKSHHPPIPAVPDSPTGSNRSWSLRRGGRSPRT